LRRCIVHTCMCFSFRVKIWRKAHFDMQARARRTTSIVSFFVFCFRSAYKYVQDCRLPLHQFIGLLATRPTMTIQHKIVRRTTLPDGEVRVALHEISTSQLRHGKGYHDFQMGQPKSLDRLSPPVWKISRVDSSPFKERAIFKPASLWLLFWFRWLVG